MRYLSFDNKANRNYAFLYVELKFSCIVVVESNFKLRYLYDVVAFIILSWYLTSKLLGAVANLFAVPNSIASVFPFIKFSVSSFS